MRDFKIVSPIFSKSSVNESVTSIPYPRDGLTQYGEVFYLMSPYHFCIIYSISNIESEEPREEEGGGCWR